MGFLRAVRFDRDCTRGRWVHDYLHKARKVKDGYQDYVTSNAETRMARRTELVLLRVRLRSIFEAFNALKQLSKNHKWENRSFKIYIVPLCQILEEGLALFLLY
jgi:hypothetical protein